MYWIITMVADNDAGGISTYAVTGSSGRSELAEILVKYHYRMVPVVDAQDRLLGVVRYNDIMKGASAPTKD